MILFAPARALAARPRLLIAGAFGALLGILVPVEPLSTRLLIAWDGGILLHLVLLAIMMARATSADLQRRAEREDPGAALILALFLLASLASVVAIGAELYGSRQGGEQPGLGRLVLVVATILLSWLFAHAMFGLHYAHDYYAGHRDRKGLKFPGEKEPDYWDFMYFSFNLGAAAQTSDVQVESRRMRRVVLLHTIISFLFNTSILALAINVGAGMLGG
ncbi:DUF1345 domain-containing protein [Enterovirga rhinocerotis]|uniref:Putative membrane protein n=1 Tax=Enterovirga rhinocerotis TaxID=1339210 RepID=A0A4R7BVU7_9HYPH|nr:DUF1345 domain-containing protein [Enterovirga rhinocerotis]TDR89671.1 putative membrane protein [Enterovirga rhinocerotis]